MGTRRPGRRTVLLLSALLATGIVAGAPATQAGTAKFGPPAKMLSALKGSDLARSQGQSEGDEGGGESDEILARSALESAITTAPGTGVSAAALRSASRSAASIATAGGSWRELTNLPYLDDPIPGYGPEGFSNWGVGWGVVSGRMTALASSRGAVFAGGADGGVWKSTDRGVTWHRWSTGLPRMAIGALRTNPHDGSVWVGLGEASTNFDAHAAIGVYRLRAGGTTWQRVGGDELLTRNVYELRFIGQYAFAATHAGLYRHSASAAAGHWQKALKPDPNPGNSPYRSSHITSVIAVPGTGEKTVLAALGWRGGTLPSDRTYNGFYVSTASGAPGTFHKITPTGDIDPTTIGRTTFSAGGGKIYAVVESAETVSLAGQGVYVSSHGAVGPWKLIADPAKLLASGSALDTSYFPGVQAWYNQYIQVDPTNPKHLYLGLEEVYESTDGGATWFTIGAYWNYGIECSKGDTDPYNCPPTTHPDQHSIAFIGGQVFVGGDGGIWRRSKGAHSRRGWFNTNRTLHTLQYYGVAAGRLPGGGEAVYGGLQDNGGALLRPSAPRFVNNFTGDGGDVLVDPHNANRVVNEYVYLDMALSTNQGKNDVEISPSCLTAADPPDPCDDNPQFVAPFEADVSAPNQHWVAGGAYVWESHKGWNTRCAGAHCDWKMTYDPGTPGPAESITDLGVKGSTVYIGWCQSPCNPNQGGPFVRGLATNYGGTWHAINTAGLPNRFVTGVTVDPASAAHAYITFGGYSRRWISSAGVGHVFETKDGGATWKDISRNLPDAPFTDLVVWGGRIAASSDVGVFTRPKAGSHSWSKLGSGLPPVRVWELSVGADGDLIAGTHGLGLWEVSRP